MKKDIAFKYITIFEIGGNSVASVVSGAFGERSFVNKEEFVFSGLGLLLSVAERFGQSDVVAIGAFYGKPPVVVFRTNTSHAAKLVDESVIAEIEQEIRRRKP